MCLEIDYNAKIEKSIEDKIVYKLYNINSDGMLESPYQGSRVVLGLQKRVKLGFWNNGRNVEEGYHSFATKLQARMAKFHYPWLRNCVMVECKIPKGEEFVEGKFGPFLSIASTNISLVKLCKRDLLLSFRAYLKLFQQILCHA